MKPQLSHVGIYVRADPSFQPKDAREKELADILESK